VILRQVSTVTLGNIIVALLSFIWNIVLIRFGGIEVAKSFYLFQVYFVFITALISMGIPAAVMHWQMNIKVDRDFIIYDARFIKILFTIVISISCIVLVSKNLIWLMLLPVGMLEILFITNSNSLILFRNKLFFIKYVLIRQISQFLIFGLAVWIEGEASFIAVVVAIMSGYITSLIWIHITCTSKTVPILAFYKKNSKFVKGMAIKGIVGPLTSMLERQFINHFMMSEVFVTFIFIQKCFDGIRVLFESAEKIFMKKYFKSHKVDLKDSGAFTAYLKSITLYAWITLMFTPLIILLVPILYIDLPYIARYTALIGLCSIASIYSSSFFLVAYNKMHVGRLIFYNAFPLFIMPFALIPFPGLPVIQLYYLLLSIVAITYAFIFNKKIVGAGNLKLWFIIYLPFLIMLGIYACTL